VKVVYDFSSLPSEARRKTRERDQRRAATFRFMGLAFALIPVAITTTILDFTILPVITLGGFAISVTGGFAGMVRLDRGRDRYLRIYSDGISIPWAAYRQPAPDHYFVPRHLLNKIVFQEDAIRVEVLGQNDRVIPYEELHDYRLFMSILKEWTIPIEDMAAPA
jgi:hypothetical protein